MSSHTVVCPSDLNPSQWQAVTQRGSNLLIVAGPGTGKTHTLTYRISSIAQELKTDESILAITFTNKAAEEMRERLQKRLRQNHERVFIGTFHQLALHILRQHGNLKMFEVADEQKMDEISKQVWPDKKNSERRKLLGEISRCKSVDFTQPLSREAQNYQNVLRSKNYYDFDDLLLELWILLKDPVICKAVQQTYRYIFVDEYQDINPIQHALLKVFAQQNYISAIGDPNQAIYSFRGSNVKYFDSFLNDFPKASTLTLTENYRSAQNLLSACGQVMAKTNNPFVPELTAKIFAAGRLTIYAASTDKAEAEYVVHQIERMVGGTSMFSHDSARVTRNEEGTRSFGDIAVLYRLKSECLALKEAFDRSGIPYCVSGEEKKDEKDIFNDVYIDHTVEACIEAEKVCLMTIHAAKGLEFPVVFMIGCEENILPLNLEGMCADKEEERRLFYVGMTRAKEALYLLRAKKRRLYGKTYHNAPSPFLADIEEELKEYEKSAAKKKKKKNEDQMKLF